MPAAAASERVFVAIASGSVWVIDDGSELCCSVSCDVVF